MKIGKKACILIIIVVCAVFIFFKGGTLLTGLFVGTPATPATKIGVIMPRPGNSSSVIGYRNDIIKNALETSVQSYSSNAENNGISLIYRYYDYPLGAWDDSYVPGLEDSYHNVTSEGAKIILFMGESSGYEKIMTLCENDRTILISPTVGWSWHDFDDVPIDYSFRVRDWYISPAEILAEIIRNRFNISSAVAFYQDSPYETQTDGYISAIIFKQSFEKVGGKVIGIYDYIGTGFNISGIEDVIKTQRPQAAFFSSTFGSGAFDIIREIKNSDPETKFFMSLYSFPNRSIDSGAEGLTFVSFGIGVDGAKESIYSDYVALSMEILEKSLADCGENAECIREELHTKEFDTRIGKVRFREKGSIIMPYQLKQVGDTGYVNLFQYNLIDDPNFSENLNITCRNYFSEIPRYSICDR